FARPTMSILPLPVRSPTCTSTQVTLVDQAPHRLLAKRVPVDTPTSHWPVAALRPTISALPPPVKSPTWPSTQSMVGSHWPQSAVERPAAVEMLTHHCPVS